ncbi:hypothetical protein [Solobacterium moorei]|uniref:hypothetical protein n=1 Tax=Solobacterium moorei TaxID=102148 RepID=UPI0023EF67FE|nr:hypothetical protein [Solobacterium moorei]
MKNKEKYDLNTLKIEWSPQTSERRYFSVKIKHNKKSIFSKEMTPTETGTSAYNAWLEEECDSKILTEKEKAYLSAVIKPFRKDVMSIIKRRSIANEKEFIAIELKREFFSLPFFEKDTMYKGMKYGKRYTLKELGL